nr:helix-turn-helix domain-containing protein [Mesorhizobium loti]
MLQLHRNGEGPTSISKAVGCSRMQVYRILRDA